MTLLRAARKLPPATAGQRPVGGTHGHGGSADAARAGRLNGKAHGYRVSAQATAMVAERTRDVRRSQMTRGVFGKLECGNG